MDDKQLLEAAARAGVALLGRIEPQPPKGIKYMLGDESWLPDEERAPRRLHCEEWGSLGPLELNPEIHDNGHGFRVRTSDFLAPSGAIGFIELNGVYYWTDTDEYGRKADSRAAAALDSGPAKVEGTAEPTSGQERLAHGGYVADGPGKVPPEE